MTLCGYYNRKWVETTGKQEETSRKQVGNEYGTSRQQAETSRNYYEKYTEIGRQTKFECGCNFIYLEEILP